MVVARIDVSHSSNRAFENGAQWGNRTRIDCSAWINRKSSDCFWSFNSDRLPCGKVVSDYEFSTSSGNAQILGQWVQ